MSNRVATIYGATIPFLVISWAAVLMRLWVRFRIMRDPGWDDYLVVLASCLNSMAAIFVMHTIKYGLGQHYLYLGEAKQTAYQKYFYMENAVYITETAVIKMSLLVQYLRIFRAGIMRYMCLTLLCLVALWGLSYGFLAWFPCFPVQAMWRRAEFPNAKCYGFGFNFFELEEFIALFESHTALNMVFDISVFTMPMVLFTRPHLRKNSIFSLAGIFMIGAVVVMTSIWRLYSIVLNRAATLPYIDFTWWAPITLILSCLEINLAIMCASMPVFWPHIEKSFTAIFVTREVHVTEHRRLDDEYELENGKSGTKRNGSMKSESGNSRESLTREISRDESNGGSGDNGDSNAKRELRLSGHYRDPYLMAQIDPFSAEAGSGIGGVETNVDSNPDKPKWRI
ncbi:hypothetical protein P280DRAFT_467718 [Massarina eburnea CBS 473.64]|uniref:Rhodopsin domain-containing protein n=1 Tax=Massarina eburnea CBS 473.64 TaxID=1395130 RepID=A0A6A6S441_9PLEO|nr:hypothetical protein P280DRAFT_467718 [Massarina eburnea CBS 473.64]